MSSLADEKARAEKWLARRRECDPAGARNYAEAPGNQLLPAGETRLLWARVSAGARPGIDQPYVPISPRLSGRVRVHCLAFIKNESEAEIDVSLRATVDGTGIDEAVSCAFLPRHAKFVIVDFDCMLPVSRTSRIGVLVNATGCARLGSATLALQEIARKQ